MFCAECRGLMRPVAGVLTCPRCGHRNEDAPESLVVKGKLERRIDKYQDIGVIEDPKAFKMQIHPVDRHVQCGRCKNWGASYYLQQTRRADEPTTRFYECTKCGKRWKSGK